VTEHLGAGAGNIVLRPGAAVHGTLNSLRDEGFAILDRFEGVAGGHYERQIVPVVRADTGATVEAITYVALKVGDEVPNFSPISLIPSGISWVRGELSRLSCTKEMILTSPVSRAINTNPKMSLLPIFIDTRCVVLNIDRRNSDLQFKEEIRRRIFEGEAA
jgi:hypothetical protein